MFVCPNCGANIIFDPGKQMLHCDYCDADFPPEAAIRKDDADENTYTESEADESAETGYKEYETTVFTCKECGGEILANENTAVTFCSYCGASTVLMSRVTKERAPEYIIPFKITKQKSEELYKNTLKKALFAPKYMKEDTVIEKFRGIYMPYWVYNFTENRQVNLTGQKDSRSGDYIIHTHYAINTQVDAQYNGLSFDASSQFSDSLSAAIAPYDFKEAQPFNTSYMSGFYADVCDTDSRLYEDQCKSIVVDDIFSRISKERNVKGITVKTTSKATLTPEKTESNLGYFPVWFLSCRHKDRVSYAVINGQTGEVATDIPVDFKKYLLGSLILAIPLFALLYLIPVIRPVNLVVFALVFAIISMIIICSQENQIYTRENNLDDKGLMAKQGLNEKAIKAARKAENKKSAAAKKKTSPLDAVLGVLEVVLFIIGAGFFGYLGALLAVGLIVVIKGIADKAKQNKLQAAGMTVQAKAPGSRKFALCSKPLIGTLIAAGVWVFAPPADEYYYIAAVVCIVTVLLSFFDIIKGHNELATRKLPQFDKRGGDI